MKNVEAKVEIVADLMQQLKDSDTGVNKKEFAKSKGISPSTLNRYVKMFEHDAAELLNMHTYLEDQENDIKEGVKADMAAEQAEEEDHTREFFESAGVELVDDKEERAEEEKAEKPVTKKSIATDIVKEMKDEKRKDVIAALMSKAGLTKSGAGTYYYNIKKELGL